MLILKSNWHDWRKFSDLFLKTTLLIEKHQNINNSILVLLFSMLFLTHILLGITFFLLLRNYFSEGSTILFFLLILLGSILPDIDEKHSRINKWFGIVGSIVAFFAKHRGFFHSLLFHGIIFFAISYFFNTYYAWALLLGYTAHIVGDGITPMGVQLFYPFSQFKIRGPIKTGGFWEGIIMIVLIIVIIKQFW